MINVIPKPNSIVEKSGEFTLTEGMGIMAEGALEPIVNRFIADVKRDYELGLAIKSEGAIRLVLTGDQGGQGEEYKLTVTTEGITLKASSEKGIAYGMATLHQMIEGNTVPCVEIEDAPAYPWRGYMLDVSRHFFGKQYIKKVLDAMAFYKMNLFHWHLTDDQGWRIEIKKYPKLTEVGSTRTRDGATYSGYFTQEDIREIVDYATERHITIMPEIDIPGHLSAAIAAYPHLSCTEGEIMVPSHYGVLHNIACAGKDSTYQFTFDVLDEVCALFPGPYVHIGGDEVPKKTWKKCPNCQQKIKDEGLQNEEELQGYFTNTVAEHLKKLGKRTVVWNDSLKSGNINDDVIVHHWINFDHKPRSIQATNKGHQMVNSDWGALYLDYPNDVHTVKMIYNYDPVMKGITETENVLGIQVNLWTEYVPTADKADVMTFPRLLANAEAGWTEKGNKSFKGFLRRLKEHYDYFPKRGIKAYKYENVTPGFFERLASIAKHVKMMASGLR